VGVEPRLDVAEQAAVDLQVWLQTTHEGEDGGAVTLTNLFIGVEAQTNVVVAPDAHGLDLPKQANRFLEPLAHLENVAEDDETLGPVLLEHGDGLCSSLVRSWMSASNPSFIGFLFRRLLAGSINPCALGLGAPPSVQHRLFYPVTMKRRSRSCPRRSSP
jgi:hypothetical protein